MGKIIRKTTGRGKEITSSLREVTRMGTPIMDDTGRLRSKGVLFSDCRYYKRVRISRAEV